MSSVAFVANVAGAVANGVACLGGDISSCMYAGGQIVSGVNRFNAPIAPQQEKEGVSPTRQMRDFKCYGAGQFIPGGGRAPKEGICM